jgi:predicted metal-dependent hydrolase
MRRRYKAGDVIETKFYKIELRTGPELKAKSSHSTIQLFYPDFSTEQGHKVLEDFMEKIYLVEAWLILPPRLEELASQHGFRYNKVTIRDNRRNWGSCSSANNISLNMQMMKLPDELIDYILLHELVHTEIKDHSARFWKKLDECTGFRARELAQEVKKYSTYTL